MQCPQCQHDNPPGAKFCAECACPMARHCPACGSDAPPAAKFCPECAAPLAAPPPPAADGGTGPNVEPSDAGERRQLTVVFCDLVGSTPLSQQLDAEEWRYVVAQYQKAARAAVERWGGHVAKELGDGLLIYFGWPDAREDDPERAIRACLAILDAMGPVNDRLSAGDGTRLAVRIGIHTGPVVIADGGEVFGETANVASRVQGAAEPDTVAITAATQRLVAGIFVLEERGPQALKGVQEPMPLYRVVQPSGVRSRLGVAAGRLTRFVGRDVELATLVDRWERAADGEGQNVLLVGEAGAGKSRLAYELRERLAAVPHTWLECGATPYTEGTPFHPVIALVAQGVAFTAADTPAEKVEKIARGLRDLSTPEHVSLLADLLGLPPPIRLQLHPDVQRRKTMELLAEWNLASSAIQPLVLLVEDLHWCDASTLELVGRIIAQSATARVLLIGTARPEFSSPWPARSNLATLQLARLTKRQAREMVTTLLAGVSAETLDTLVARADGVPLYVEELTKAMADPGSARGADAIPTTLAGSLMARLDRLSTAKEVAQRAAVLGREFGYPLLAAVAAMDEAGLRLGLERLVDAEILFRRGEPPEATYTFKHALLQEAAYESLLKRTRQQLHARVVDVLLEHFAERAATEPELVARHAEAAGRGDDAIAYYDRAGEKAQARSAHGEAIGQLRKAIALLTPQPASPPRDAHEMNLQLALGASLMAVRGYAHPEAAAAYERAVALGSPAADATRFGVAQSGLAICYYTCGQVERGRALAAEVLAAALARGDSEQALLGYANVGAANHWQGKFAVSLAHCDQGFALYDAARHHGQARIVGTDQGVSMLSYAAWNLWYLGQPDAALARAGDTVALSRRLDDPFSLALALYFESIVHWHRRSLAAIAEPASQLVGLSRAHGFPLWSGLGHILNAASRVVAGDAAALPAMMDGFTQIGETGDRVALPKIYALLAEAQRAAGQLAEARDTVATALRIAAETGQPYIDADLHRLDGDLLLAAGAGAEAASARYDRALSIARAQGARSLELRAAVSRARLMRDQGQRAEARALLAPVYATFTEGFDTRDLVAAKALLAEL